jgi:hypothetical protein
MIELIPSIPAFLALLGLGAWVAADSTSVGQIMISRPVVAATLAGWIVGAPAAGALLGLILEAFQMGILPVGAARYPEPGPPAVVGGAVFGLAAPSWTALLTIVVFVLAWEWVSGRSVRSMRQNNAALVRLGDAPDQDRSLEWRHLTAVVVDLGRGGALVLVGIPLCALAAASVDAAWAGGDLVARAVLAAALAGMLASSLRFFGSTLWPFFGVGGVCGLILLLLG